MTRHASRRRAAPLLGLLAALVLLPVRAGAQETDCAGLRADIEAADGAGGGSGRYAVALRQQRDEIARTRAYADQSGCGDGFFDDPDSVQCRALNRRIDVLQIALQRLQDQAERDGAGEDERRRALREDYNARCTTASAEPGVPDATMPVDPGNPEAPPAPAPASPARSAVVLCVRQCDGAYYPLAVDVASDRLGDMDRVCRAQCPAAQASAYAGRSSEDVANAVNTEGTRYADLATAFQFRKTTSSTCSCRARDQSWAEALAGAEAMIEPHKGDVTVTPALAAAMMARPAAVPSRTVRPAKTPPRKAGTPATAPAADETVPPADASGRDLTREFRRSVPPL